MIPDEVVNGALVNAIAAVGRQIRDAVGGSRTADDLTTAGWFESSSMTGTLPDQPDLPLTSKGRLAAILRGDEAQTALQELLTARLTDAPETEASRARDAVRLAIAAADPDAALFGEALGDYYDSQICSFVAGLEAQDPLLLAQTRSEAFNNRGITVLHAIEQSTAALTDKERRPDALRTTELLEAGT